MDRHVTPLKTHYPDSEPTSLCSYSLKLHVYQRSRKYQLNQFIIYHTRGEHVYHYPSLINIGKDNLLGRIDIVEEED